MSASTSLFQKIDCVRLHIGNLDEAPAFYRDRLGHDLVGRTDRSVGNPPVLDTSKGLLITDETGNIISNTPAK